MPTMTQRTIAIIGDGKAGGGIAAGMAKVNNRDRVAILHRATPANSSPQAKIVKGTRTSDATIRTISAWMRALGKLAVRYGFDFRGVVCGPVSQRDRYGLVINPGDATRIYPTLNVSRTR